MELSKCVQIFKTSNKIQPIQGLLSPVNSRLYNGKGSRQCLMRAIVEEVHPKSHNRGPPGQLDWVQSLLLNMSSNYGLSDWVQLLKTCDLMITCSDVIKAISLPRGQTSQVTVTLSSTRLGLDIPTRTA